MQTLPSHKDRLASSAAPEAGTRDQRGAERIRLLMRTAKLVSAKGEFLCVLRDASATGFRARIFHPLSGASQMELELASGLRYPIEKVWEEQSEAGFKFSGDIAIEELLNELGPFPKRGVRLHISLETNVHVGLEKSPATISNISQQGARIETHRSLVRDQRLRLDITGLRTVDAQVRWREQDTYGLIFDDTFRFDELALLVHQLQLPRPARGGDQATAFAARARIEL